LLGLSLFIIKQKTKEIGIRKVLGASVQSIVRLLSFNYLKWIAISTLLAWPISYWITHKWLQNFSSKINLIDYWWVFLLAGFLATIITLLVVSIQTIKYASVNPAKSLKYE
jgi:putative ABC transport system permease protein